LIKKIIAFAVDKAIVNHILFILMLIMALFAYQKIPKELFPPITLDKIVIRGGYIGASADILDKIAVKPIEDDLKSVDNISNIESGIRNGTFAITIDIKDGANPQIVLDNVKDVISNTKRDLPKDMDEPVAKVLIQHFPLLLIAVSGDVPKEELLDAAKKLKNKLSSQFKDLGTIDIRGDSDREIKIELNNKKIEALGINRQLLYQAISNLSTIYPIGDIKNRGKSFYISSYNGSKNVKDLENTLLNIGNIKVKLKDIATVKFGLSDSKEISTFNGKENISLNVTKLKKGNAIKLSKEIKSYLKEFQKEYKNIKFQVYFDTSIFIRNRINLVTSNIFFGLILVFISIFLSVNWKISTVVALGIPTSFFIALIFANELGYSINMLSMLGALLALGMLVDEAIVVAENIYRHLEMGKSPRAAAIDGAAEMFPAVLTATATTIFAFLPLLLMSGKIGIFVKILPVMITILLLSSLFEAFYFLPIHAKELFNLGKIKSNHKEGKLWVKLKKIYQNILLIFLRYKKISTLLLSLFIITGTFLLLKHTKFELMPKFDAEQVYISGQVNINSSLKNTKKLLKPIEEALLKDLNKSDISSITSIVGIKFHPDNTFESGDYLFHIFVNLKERKPKNFFDKYINPYLSLEYDNANMQRDHTAFEILKDIQKTLNNFNDKRDKNGKRLYKDLTTFVPQAGVVKNDIEISVIDNPSLNVDYALKTLKDKLKSIKGVIDASSSKKIGPSEIKLKINRYGERLGFNEVYISNSLRGLLLNAEYSKVLDNSGIIRVKLKSINKDKFMNLKNIQITTPNGQEVVMLKDIVDFITIKSPVRLQKKDAKRLWSVTAQVQKGVITANDVMKKLQPTITKLKKEGYEFMIEGEAKATKQVVKEMAEAAVIAIFLIFLSLVLMFNSIKHSLIVLSVIPLSIFGALLGTKLLSLNISMFTMMGIVGLAGVVVNDAIIMIDFIKNSKNINDIASKAQTRLRPIMLTSITTVLGLFTLMFFASGQALIIQPMAVALGFGVAWATVLNLIFIPTLFALTNRIKDEKSI